MIEILTGDSLQLIESGAGFDVQITDPPYSEHVHTNATSQSKRRGTRHREMGFAALTPELRAHIMHVAATVRRWSIVYADIEGAHEFRALAHRKKKRGTAQYIRTLPWVRWSMPQLSGDRPPQAREDLLIFHAPPTCDDVLLFYGTEPGRKSWNGPGNLTHLQHKCLRGEGKHKAEKPLDQALDLVDWFTNPGELVLDLCCGRGTVPLACKLLDRDCVAIEVDPDEADRARARVAGTLNKRDNERLERWMKSRQ